MHLFVFFSAPQVSTDLPQKQRHIEDLLRDFYLYQEQLSKLSSWASTTRNQLEKSPDTADHEVI